MNHCYTDCIKVSDDDYRIRYDCVICRKSFYQLKDRTQGDNNSLRDDILLIQGSPYITCGNNACKQLERLHDSRTIRIFVKWEEMPEGKYVWINGVRTVQPRFKPVIIQRKGCMKCANFQDSESQRLGRLHMFNGNNTPISEPILPATGVKYTSKPDVTVVPYTFPSAAGSTVQQCWETTPDPKVDVAEGLYGPYNDRKGVKA